MLPPWHNHLAGISAVSRKSQQSVDIFVFLPSIAGKESRELMNFLTEPEKICDYVETTSYILTYHAYLDNGRTVFYSVTNQSFNMHDPDVFVSFVRSIFHHACFLDIRQRNAVENVKSASKRL